jgi:hypothetical protein
MSARQHAPSSVRPSDIVVIAVLDPTGAAPSEMMASLCSSHTVPILARGPGERLMQCTLRRASPAEYSLLILLFEDLSR